MGFSWLQFVKATSGALSVTKQNMKGGDLKNVWTAEKAEVALLYEHRTVPVWM